MGATGEQLHHQCSEAWASNGPTR